MYRRVPPGLAAPVRLRRVWHCETGSDAQSESAKSVLPVPTFSFIRAFLSLRSFDAPARFLTRQWRQAPVV